MRLLFLLLAGYAVRTLDRIRQQQENQTVKITDAVAVIGKIEVTLGKASAEINKEVAALREKLAAAGDVPPELEDGLARLETLATNLDNVVPDDVTTDGEPPVITDPVTEQPTEEQAPE